jgi:hypothetical protein
MARSIPLQTPDVSDPWRLLVALLVPDFTALARMISTSRQPPLERRPPIDNPSISNPQKFMPHTARFRGIIRKRTSRRRTCHGYEQPCRRWGNWTGQPIGSPDPNSNREAVQANGMRKLQFQKCTKLWLSYGLKIKVTVRAKPQRGGLRRSE